MRTIQIINVRWFNATAWYGLYLGKLLQSNGHETLIITLPETANWDKAIEFGFQPKYLPLNSKNPLVYPQLYYQLRQLIKNFKPDVVNCHRGEGFILCAMLREDLKNFALVRTRGDQRLPKNNKINIWLHKQAADAVITTNSRMAAHFVNNMGIPQKQVHTILGGVDTEYFDFTETGRQKVRAQFGFDDSHYVIGLIGRYDEVKGHADLIKAVAALRKRCKNLINPPDIRILFIGHPTPHFPEERLIEYAKNEGIAEFVHFTGRTDDMPAAISALDAGVISSLWSEAIARAALEIMACKIPLISTTVGVMPDLLPEYAMYEPGNVTMLTDRLLAMLQNETFVEDLLLHEKTRMNSLSAKTFLEDTINVYNQALLNLK